MRKGYTNLLVVVVVVAITAAANDSDGGGGLVAVGGGGGVARRGDIRGGGGGRGIGRLDVGGLLHRGSNVGSCRQGRRGGQQACVSVCESWYYRF